VIAKEYSVTSGIISLIKTGKGWLHITHGKSSSLGMLHGERNHKAKITENDVRAIRGDPRANKIIAADYGLCRQQVLRIKTGGSWRHVD
jgi:hypothetical protein